MNVPPKFCCSLCWQSSMEEYGPTILYQKGFDVSDDTCLTEFFVNLPLNDVKKTTLLTSTVVMNFKTLDMILQLNQPNMPICTVPMADGYPICVILFQMKT